MKLFGVAAALVQRAEACQFGSSWIAFLLTIKTIHEEHEKHELHETGKSNPVSVQLAGVVFRL